jgi:uncharacterized protein
VGGRKTGQWLVSSAIGLHFTSEGLGQLLDHFAAVLIGALITLLLSLIGILLLRRAGESHATAFFANMPGGASEMVNLAQRHNAKTAEALQLSVALVKALQVLQLFLVMFLAEPLLRLWQRS